MSEAFRVAQVLDTLSRGGAERVLVSLANGLDPGRFHVHVLVTREPGPLARELAPHVTLLSLDRRHRWDLRGARRLAELLHRHRIELVHTHSHSSAYFVRLVRAVAGQRWLHVMHDHHGPVERKPLLRLSDRLLLRGLDHYFAASDRLLRYGREWLGIATERSEQLLNAVVAPVVRPSVKNAVFTIVQVARVVPDKNQALAIDLAARLRRTVPAFRWLLIGRADSRYARACQREAARLGLDGELLFLGERDDVHELLAGAHVGVLTSRSEALPLALLEYMAAQLPVVVIDVGDCGTAVRASGGGVVVAPDDPLGFVEALRRFAVEPALARRAGLANADHFRRHYGTDAMVQRVSDVYARLLTSSRGVP